MPRETGFTNINITYENKVIKHIPVLVNNTPDISLPSTSTLRTLKNSYQTGEEWIILSASKLRSYVPQNTGIISIIAQSDANTTLCENIRNQKQSLTLRLKQRCVGTNTLRLDITPKQTYVVFRKNNTSSS